MKISRRVRDTTNLFTQNMHLGEHPKISFQSDAEKLSVDQKLEHPVYRSKHSIS